MLKWAFAGDHELTIRGNCRLPSGVTKSLVGATTQDFNEVFALVESAYIPERI
jgi:hypothetical protein